MAEGLLGRRDQMIENGTLNAEQDTTSSFTAAAIRFAQGKPLELIDGTQYRDLCGQYGIDAYSVLQEMATSELLQPDSTNVRLISLDCASQGDRDFCQHCLFAVGTLSIGASFAFTSPGVGGFDFSQYGIREISCDWNLDRRSLGQFTISLTSGLDERETYSMTFEGRYELIKSLYQAASARRSAVTPGGCLVILAIPFALTGFVKVSALLF